VDVLNLGETDLFVKDGAQQLMVKGSASIRLICRTRSLAIKATANGIVQLMRTLVSRRTLFTSTRPRTLNCWFSKASRLHCTLKF